MAQRRFNWTPEATQILRDHYADMPTQEVADMIGNGCTTRMCFSKAKNLKLRKSQRYMDSEQPGRFSKGRHYSPSTEFKPGHVPANKGKKMSADQYSKCAPTMFKPGRDAPDSRNYKPIGSLRITRDGQLERKITDDPNLYPARRWRPVTRLVWEANNGPIPPGHIVRFKDGMHTIVESEITLDRLECISKGENMRRNSIHKLPPELADTCRLIGRVNRQINKRAKNEKQT